LNERSSASIRSSSFKTSTGHAPDQPPVVIEYDGRQVTATNVSQYKGIRVWVVDEKPNSKLEAELDRLVAQSRS
jgi:hypothetical protein